MVNRDVLTIKIAEETITIEILITIHIKIREEIKMKDQITHQIATTENQNKNKKIITKYNIE